MRLVPHVLLSAVLAVSCPTAAPPSAEPKPVSPNAAEARQAAKGEWTVDAVLYEESSGGFRFSPDGEFVTWTVSGRDAESGEGTSRLFFASSTEPDTAMPLTHGHESLGSVRWSPDGESIAFLTDRPVPGAEEGELEPSQIWVMSPFGGEARCVSRVARGVQEFAWADGATILFTATEDPSLAESLAEEAEDDSVVVEDEENEPPVRLFELDVESGDVVRLTENTDRIAAFTVSPDGLLVLAVHDRSLRFEWDQAVKPLLVLHDLETGDATPLFEDGRYNIGRVEWEPSGEGFYFEHARTTHPTFVNATVSDLFYYSLKAGREIPVPLDWPRGIGYDLETDGAGFAAFDGGVAVLLADGARQRLARFDKAKGRNEWARRWIDGEERRGIFSVGASADGKRLLWHESSRSQPTRWKCAELKGNATKAPVTLADDGLQHEGRAMARTEVIQWKGARDETIEGVLYYPKDYREGERHPLMLYIHGGPFWADYDMWYESSYLNNFTQRGAFVLCANYHGSSAYGLEFAESIANGHYYDLPVADLLAGVDHLVEKGMADPERLATAGWSNGGILTLALLTETARFKAASCGAGGMEWIADWAFCAFGHSFSAYYMGATPIEDPQRYLTTPFFRFKDIATPLIIFHGTEDRAVPAMHGWSAFRAMQLYGKAPVRFVTFPGEEHSLSSIAHQRRQYTEEIAWMDKYLFGKTDEPPARKSLAPDSPLAVALALKDAARTGGRLGVETNGILVPEVIRAGAIDVGRFEVTRAQWNAYDPSYTVPPGTEDFPATGMQASLAQEYCAWLAKTAGGAWRLPTAEEFEEWSGEAAGDANTLDYWAGYEPTPDDAARLRALAAQIGPDALLMRAGSFPRCSDALPIHDIDGNAAEWALDEESGDIITMGAWAAAPADTKDILSTPEPAYVGLRVVRERP